jgi:hypothetical protein
MWEGVPGVVRVADLANPLVDVVGLLLVGVLLVLQMRQRRVSVRRLWLIPLLVVVLTGVTVGRNPPPDLLAWAWLGAALIAGLAIGVARAALVDVRHVDPEAGVLQVQNTQLGLALWLGVFAARTLIRQVVARSSPESATVELVTASLLTLSVGNLVANAAATYRAYERARRSLAW